MNNRAHVENLEPRQLFAAAIPTIYPTYGGTVYHPDNSISGAFTLTVASQNAAGKIVGQLELTPSTGPTYEFSFTGSVNRHRAIMLTATGEDHRKVILRGKVGIDVQFAAPRSIAGVFRSSGPAIAGKGTFSAVSPLAPV